MLLGVVHALGSLAASSLALLSISREHAEWLPAAVALWLPLEAVNAWVSVRLMRHLDRKPASKFAALLGADP